LDIWFAAQWAVQYPENTHSAAKLIAENSAGRHSPTDSSALFAVASMPIVDVIAVIA
jgi:hypothetical protein